MSVKSEKRNAHAAMRLDPQSFQGAPAAPHHLRSGVAMDFAAFIGGLICAASRPEFIRTRKKKEI